MLGFVTWTLIGVFGLGTAALTFIGAYRRENPAPPPRLAPLTPPERSAAAAAVADGIAAAGARAAGAIHRRSATSATGGGDAPSLAATPPGHCRRTDLASFPHAPSADRLAAFVLDVILVVIAAQVLDLIRHDHDSAVFLLLARVSHRLLDVEGQTTVGGIICQLRVVRVDGAPLTFADALVRGLSSIFSLAVLGLGASGF